MPNCFRCNKELEATYCCDECLDKLHAQIDKDLERIDNKHALKMDDGAYNT